MNQKETFMRLAIEEAKKQMSHGQSGPFGAVVVKDNEVIAKGVNQVVRLCDPTAHAEILAIRSACEKLETHHLERCEIYATSEPCPMCLAAIYWAKIDRVYYSCTQSEASSCGFDDSLIYKDFCMPIENRQVSMSQILPDSAKELFDLWKNNPNKVPY